MWLASLFIVSYRHTVPFFARHFCQFPRLSQYVSGTPEIRGPRKIAAFREFWHFFGKNREFSKCFRKPRIAPNLVPPNRCLNFLIFMPYFYTVLDIGKCIQRPFLVKFAVCCPRREKPRIFSIFDREFPVPLVRIESCVSSHLKSEEMNRSRRCG